MGITTRLFAKAAAFSFILAAEPSPAAAPPFVGYVAFWGINNNGVTISWSTDVIADTVVAYGTSPALGQIYTNTGIGEASTKNHGAVLTGLIPGTTYYFVAQSTGQNGATGYSAMYSFTTTGTAVTTFILSATEVTAAAGASGTSTITVTPEYGFNSAVTLATPNWPAGITGTFGSNPVTLSSVITINVDNTVAPGKYLLTVNGSSGNLSANTTVPLTVTASLTPGFTLNATPATVNVGSTGNSSVTVTPFGGFNSPVTLTSSGWPAGITATFGTNPTTGSSVVTIAVGSGVATGTYTLPVTGTFGTLTKSTAIPLTVTSLSSGATFIRQDATTQGTWSGTYGSDGFQIPTGASNLPAYASLGLTGAQTYNWTNSTSDVRALQSARGSTARMAACYYAGYQGSFMMTLNLRDGVTHQVAIYLLDWDSASRAQSVSISDTATGTLLDSRTFTGFAGGMYGVWNINGAVTIKVSASAGNPIVSGIFLAPVNAPPTPNYTLSATAVSASVGSSGTSTITVNPLNGFNSPVTLATSNWPAGITGTFGTNPATGTSLVTINVGASVAPGPYTLPVNGTSGGLSASTNIVLTVNAVVTPGFSLNATAASAKVAAAGTSTVTVVPANGFNSAVTLAPSNWPAGISATFGTNPTNTSSVVAISVASNVAPGWYSLSVIGFSGALSASTTITLAVTSASGLSATFTGLDTTTQGNWTGKYGASGYAIANGSSSPPAFATLGLTGALIYTWVPQTTDARALQSSAHATSGTVSAYTQYPGQSLSISVAFSDTKTHKLSLYLLDWDNSSRSETITILDALSNTALDTETFSGFQNGQYVSWNINGNVIIRVSANGNDGPVVSGIFFDNLASTTKPVPIPKPGPGKRAPIPIGAAPQVYYIGNSLTDLINYDGVQSMATNAGYALSWGRDNIPGAPLYWIRDHQFDGFNDLPYGLYPTAFAYYQWDMVTFEPFNSDADTSIVDISNEGDRQVIDGWLNTVKPVSPNVQIYLYSRWPVAAASGNTAQSFKTEWEKQYYPNQPAYLSTNSITCRGFFEHLAQMVRADNSTISPPLIIPVGEVMYEINNAIIAGQISSYNSIWDIYADTIHLNHQVGSYIAGLTMYSSIYFADPRGTEVPAQYQPVDPALAATIQNIVWNVVSNYAYTNGTYVTNNPTSIPNGSPAPNPPVPIYSPLVSK